MPRSLVVIAGVSTSHMPVSLISARSAASSSLLAIRKGSRLATADFLLALDQHGDAGGDTAAGVLPGAQGLRGTSSSGPCRPPRRGRRSACRAGHRPVAARTADCSRARADRPAARRSGHRTGYAGLDSRPARHDARPPRDVRRSAAPRHESPGGQAGRSTHSAARRQSCRWSGWALIEGIRSRSNSRPREASSDASTWRSTVARVSGVGTGIEVLRGHWDAHLAMRRRHSKSGGLIENVRATNCLSDAGITSVEEVARGTPGRPGHAVADSRRHPLRTERRLTVCRKSNRSSHAFSDGRFGRRGRLADTGLLSAELSGIEAADACALPRLRRVRVPSIRPSLPRLETTRR